MGRVAGCKSINCANGTGGVSGQRGASIVRTAAIAAVRCFLGMDRPRVGQVHAKLLCSLGHLDQRIEFGLVFGDPVLCDLFNLLG